MAQRNILIMVSPVSVGRTAGISRFAKAHGWHVLTQERLGYQPLVWHGDGALVTLRSDPATVEAVRTLRRRGIPVVDLTYARPDVRLPRVSCDHEAIGRLAAEHFAERHFRHVAWFSLGWSPVHELRQRGFVSGCAAAGIEPPLTWVYFNEVRTEDAGNWPRFVRWMTQHLKSAPHPLAVFTYDEQDAARLESVCRDEGISVPEEVAILSVGNDPLLCESQPVPLSSIDQNLVENAYRAAELLERLMSGGKPPSRPILIPPAGVVKRPSTDTLAVENPTVRRALELIVRNLSRPYGAAQLADELGEPRHRLDRLFAEILGHSIGEEIRHQRFVQVKLLLKDTDLPIGRIAERTGFCNAAYLTNFFRDATGLTPKAWRQQQATGA